MINHKYRGRLNRQLDSACNRSADVPKFEYLTEINGMKVIMTDHAKQQCLKRHGIPLENMKIWFNKTADVWGNIPLEYYNQEVFVYSTHFQRGCILAYRRDCKSNNGKLCLVVVTVYPYGKASPAHKDTKTYRG